MVKGALDGTFKGSEDMFSFPGGKHAKYPQRCVKAFDPENRSSGE